MESIKTILLMRHAKSSWNHPDKKDFDRPLNKRGLKDAPRMGRYLREMKITPDAVVSSPARRARQTVKELSAEAGFDSEKITWNDSLYYDGADAYLKALKALSDDVSTVLIAGHNPSVENLVARLSAGEQKINITTANVVCFELDAESWAELEAGKCRFKWIVRPKDL